MIPYVVASEDRRSVMRFVDSLSKKHGISSYSIYEIEPIKEEITIAQIREIRKTCSFSGVGARIFILWRFDSAGIEAQNAFLKTLEESTSSHQFVLVAPRYLSLIPTILSRSKVLLLDQARKKERVAGGRVESLLKDIVAKKTYRFLSHSLLVGMNREKAKALINDIIVYFRDVIKESPNYAVPIIRQALKLKQLLETNNLNPQLAIDTLLIFIHKTYTVK